MKTIKSKKGAILFNITLVFITVIVLTTAFFVLTNKKNSFPSGIGGTQIEIIKTYQEADKILLYVDQAAKFSVDQAAYDLGLQGGYNTVSDCGKITNYMIWQTNTKECYPYFIENFGGLINKEMDKYLNNYPSQSGLTIPKDNYEFTIYTDKVIGTALEDININMYNKWVNSILIGRYSLKPSFSVISDFDINQYEGIIIKAKSIFIGCETAIDRKQCVDLIINTYLNWKSTNSGNIFFFDVETNKKVGIYDGTNFKEEEIVIKFGLDFS